MNIKSLLIGSAAALVAVSGARAADAVVAEPEAVEYVRVCDAYGAGFFYIPGTETCLKIGGYVRYQIDWSTDAVSQDTPTGPDVNGNRGWRKFAKASLNFTASSDTELGTLTSYIEMSAGQLSGRGLGLYDEVDKDGNVKTKINGVWGLDYAWISLGGLTMGYHDTMFGGGLDGEGGSGGYGDQTHLISYTFSGGNGFSAALSLEEDTYNDNFVPNVVGKVSYSAGNLGLDGWVAYDDKDRGEAFSAFNVKGRLSLAVGEAGKLKVVAFYGNHSNYYNSASKWSIGASYGHQINEKLALTGVVQYFADTNFEGAGTPNKVNLGLTADYTIVPGFAVKAAIVHSIVPGKDPTSGFLRFQRSF
jgi:hypothetical protein